MLKRLALVILILSLPGGAGAPVTSAGPQVPQVAIPARAFLMDRFEVTNAQYRVFAEATGRAHPSEPWFPGLANYLVDYPDYPVVDVSWFDAREYCAWAGKRLPTEKEWLLAATGGDGRPYPWGVALPSAELANYGCQVNRTTPVGSYPKGASPYGVADMAGNVWEWTSTLYPSGEEDPKDAAMSRVVCGGAWSTPEVTLRVSSYRSWFDPWRWAVDVGFRCAQDVK